MIPGPAAEDQAAAVITESRGTSRPGAPRAAGPDRRFRPFRWPRLSPGHGMTITAMVTTLALLGTLGAAAWQVGHIRSQAPAAGTSLAARASGTPDARGRHPGPGSQPGPGGFVRVARRTGRQRRRDHRPGRRPASRTRTGSRRC